MIILMPEADVLKSQGNCSMIKKHGKIVQE
jgi:hypothetical protein